MVTVSELFRSASGYVSPYFIVDADGNLLTQTVTVTGNRLELTSSAYISYNGDPLLTHTALGASITSIPGTLSGLTVAGTVALSGTLQMVTGTVNLNPSNTSVINNVAIGGTVAASGNFTSLTCTSTGLVSLSPTGNVTVSPTGSVTVSPTGNVTVSPNGNVTFGGSGTLYLNSTSINATAINQTINFSPTGTGTITITPTALGSINNVSIGVLTAAPGRFTSASVTTPDENWNSNRNELSTKRYVEQVRMLSFFASCG
jgi:hypothetical protein